MDETEKLKKENEDLKSELEKLKMELNSYKSMYKYTCEDLDKAKEYLKAIGITVITMTRGYV